jgi:hypothetical protein
MLGRLQMCSGAFYYGRRPQGHSSIGKSGVSFKNMFNSQASQSKCAVFLSFEAKIG